MTQCLPLVRFQSKLDQTVYRSNAAHVHGSSSGDDDYDGPSSLIASTAGHAAEWHHPRSNRIVADIDGAILHVCTLHYAPDHRAHLSIRCCLVVAAIGRAVTMDAMQSSLLSTAHEAPIWRARVTGSLTFHLLGLLSLRPARCLRVYSIRWHQARLFIIM